jgi:cardiolipin synthase A/B
MDIVILVSVIVVHALGVFSAISAVMSSRTSQGAIAWTISLVTFPLLLLAVPAYWIFGRSKFRGYVSARQNKDARARTVLEEILADSALREPRHDNHTGSIRAIEHLARMPFLSGNATELLIDGERTFESILSGIAEATDYVLVQFYIINDDDLGRQLRDALLERANAGVRVCLLYDEIGSHKLHRSYLKVLRAAGVEVRPFHSSRGRGNRFQLNFRNHRKIVVTDGQVGWVGGHNVGDEYLGKNRKIGPWRDTHIKLTGPSVLGLQMSFLEDWHWTSDEVLELSWTPVVSGAGDQEVLILPSGPADDMETASLMFQQTIHSAKERVWIASPYFVPDEGVCGALQLAVLRGVDVRVLIPNKPDHLLVYLSAFAFLGEMIDVGVKVFRYEPGFLHEKVCLVDDYASAVGTANLDNRSFRLNFEVTAIVLDHKFASEMEAMFLADFERSRYVTSEEITGRPWLKKLASRLAHLLAPVQ